MVKLWLEGQWNVSSGLWMHQLDIRTCTVRISSWCEAMLLEGQWHVSSGLWMHQLDIRTCTVRISSIFRHALSEYQAGVKQCCCGKWVQQLRYEPQHFLLAAKKKINAVEVWKEIVVHPFIYNHWTQIVSFLLTLPVAEIYERYTGC